MKKKCVKKCPFHPIDIPKDRKVVFTDMKKFVWKMDPKGYFLVKIENGMLCCGWCTASHKMIVEFRGSDPTLMIKEIVKRKLCSPDNLAYISQELMIAQNAIATKKKYVQR